jgi:hypothetical protein
MISTSTLTVPEYTRAIVGSRTEAGFAALPATPAPGNNAAHLEPGGKMKQKKFVQVIGSGVALFALLLTGMVITAPTGRATDGDFAWPFITTLFDPRVDRGFAIAPVPLDLRGKNRSLVGLGSYLVNGVASCGDCHSNPTWAAGGDPYKGETKKVNVAGYLGGGQAFGPFISRNITPDKTGRTGGHTYADFLLEFQHGIDLDHAHTQISPLLQVMPWPVFQNMQDLDARAIYEYLNSIPCLEGGPGEPANRCK